MQIKEGDENQKKSLEEKVRKKQEEIEERKIDREKGCR
jgi:hypothetical protein